MKKIDLNAKEIIGLSIMAFYWLLFLLAVIVFILGLLGIL